MSKVQSNFNQNTIKMITENASENFVSEMAAILSRERWLKRGTYRKTSSISRTLVGNKIVDNSDVVGASPVGAAPTTSSFST